MTVRRTSTAAMALVLAEAVPEISDDIACRQALGFAGFSDEQISVRLSGAQRLARAYRVAEIDRLYHRQFERRWLCHD